MQIYLSGPSLLSLGNSEKELQDVLLINVEKKNELTIGLGISQDMISH